MQAAERAAARHLQNQHTLDRYIVASSPRGAASIRATAGKLHSVLCTPTATPALALLSLALSASNCWTIRKKGH